MICVYSVCLYIFRKKGTLVNVGNVSLLHKIKYKKNYNKANEYDEKII